MKRYVYERTPTYAEDSIPRRLRGPHAARRDVYTRVVVEAGQLRVTVEGAAQVLSAGEHVLVEPERAREYTPIGSVRFHVELSRVYTNRCPFCVARFKDGSTRCRPCGAKQIRGARSPCCADAGVWTKASVWLCAACRARVTRTRR